METTACELCDGLGGDLLWQDDFCRVVLVKDDDYPGFCRVILQRHIREMTDLEAPDRLRLMQVVFATESAVRDVLNPHKINLASLGNMTPHVHWHVIPRFADDRHFPAPIWAAPKREPAAATPADLGSRLKQALSAHLSQGG